MPGFSKQRTIVALMLLMMMPACGTGSPTAANVRANPINTQAWQCENSGYVVSSGARDSDSLWLFLPGKTLQLEPAGPDSYAVAGTTMSIDGLQATLTREGNSESCTENRRLSIREDAKLRGVDFWATGNEPPWRLEMSADLILVKTGYENERHEFPAVPQQTEPAARSSQWVTANDTETLSVVIEGQACADSMSGDSFGARVKLVLNGRELQGCGTALH